MVASCVLRVWYAARVRRMVSLHGTQGGSEIILIYGQCEFLQTHYGSIYTTKSLEKQGWSSDLGGSTPAFHFPVIMVSLSLLPSF